MSLIEKCPNGHPVKVHERHFGHRVRCPRCQTVFKVPVPARRELTESSVLRILGDYSPEDSEEAMARRAVAIDWDSADSTRRCPRCGADVKAAFRICPQCHVYMPDLPNAAAG
ncbi:MAG: hypothetical protein KatS3mg110_3052 [Pirellulaceae bacterium]|nr:MAG: hypothetical protein KatS3mg110_3052 [Pirellulaceae bacterium]